MGRRKKQITLMGNSLLVKDKHRRQGVRHDNDSFLHTTELDDGTSYNRINFQSVTEQSNLEDFLTTAELAGKDFTAERQNIQIISNPGQGLKLTSDDLEKINNAQETHKALLRIPRRPQWDERTTKEDLILMERESFTDWRRQLKSLEEEEHIELTPYERNLDFWRQLWRVIERSDVIVQIVDARNPLLFRCEDLEAYVKEVNPQKKVMLLINKADYLTPNQRQLWVDYFNKEAIRAVFFSAKTEKENQEETSQPLPVVSEKYEEEGNEDGDDYSGDESAGRSVRNSESDLISSSEENDEEGREKNDNGENSDEETENSDVENLPEPLIRNDPGAQGSISGHHSYLSEAADSVNITNKVASEKVTDSDATNTPENSDERINMVTSSNELDSTAELPLNNSPTIVSTNELLDIFRHLAHPSCNGVKTIGMVGYPNVGKSSTINVLLSEKRLAVSATPGRTKHLQTLYVDQNLMLCDCPGLVFPSFVATKAHLVINGILSIDEMRDHISPINHVCELIPRRVLEATYSIMLPRPCLDDDPNRLPTAEELLHSYGAMRGFMTPRGVPDGPRASRYILKDYVKGKLLYCEPPPGNSGPEFQDKERIQQLEQLRPTPKVPPQQLTSDIDREFFAQRNSKAHSLGRGGVADFVRIDTLRHTGRGSEGSASGGSLMDVPSSSVSSLASKPWKKHNNRNKKEKLRRVHRDLDVGL